MANIAEQPIFIVDGEPKVFQAISEALGNLGAEVTRFTRPGKCLERLHAQRCDLLITELETPDMDGVELLRQVKQLAPWLPVLVMSGHADISTAVDAIKAGAEDVIEEPFDRSDFLRKVKSILEEGTANDGDLGKALTQTETRVLKLVIAGKTSKEIANLLNRSIRTVEVHREHFMRKLGVDNLVDLVKRVVTMKLIDIEGDKKKEVKPVEIRSPHNRHDKQ
ncbi:MAG: response regulator [Planctomycetota bacterium]